jgi:hypothetical protein
VKNVRLRNVILYAYQVNIGHLWGGRRRAAGSRISSTSRPRRTGIRRANR